MRRCVRGEVPEQSTHRAVHNENLFKLAETEIKNIENNNLDIDKYKTLLKLYDQADIINDIV